MLNRVWEPRAFRNGESRSSCLGQRLYGPCHLATVSGPVAQLSQASTSANRRSTWEFVLGLLVWHTATLCPGRAAGQFAGSAIHAQSVLELKISHGFLARAQELKSRALAVNVGLEESS